MRLVTIASSTDDRLAPYAAFGEPDVLSSRRVFIAEGRLVVRRAVELGCRVESVLVSETVFHALEDVWSKLPESTPVYVCPLQAFREVTGFDIHRGCLALVERPVERTVADVVREARTIVVLENVGNPDNVGGVFRNAAAFATDGVLLSPACSDPLYRKAIRTSMAATLAVPFARACNWPSDLGALRSYGFSVCALTLDADGVALGPSTPRPFDRIALLAGHEGDGLSAEALCLADLRVRIPISPAVDSLNVAVAVGIALHAYR